MRKTWLLIIGLLFLIGIEIAKVYFIMPFPGSQQSNSIDIAYFLHNNIWWMRILGVVIVVVPFRNLLSNGKIGTGLIDKSLQDKLAMIASAYPGSTITSLNDADSFKIKKPDGGFDYPHAPPDAHGKGQAVDFVPKDYDPTKAAQYVKSLKEMGFITAQAETVGQGNATGPHLHAALKDGGITNGPSLAGEAGTEAVVPLPDGRTIPVSMDHNPLIAKFDEMISILKDHRDISEKTLWATA